MSDSLWPHGLQHARPPCPSSAPRVYPNPCPLSRWCHPTISSSVIPFSCLQSFPASGSFPMNQFFSSGGQNIGVSASASVLPMYFQDWFHWCLSILKDQLSHHSSWDVFYFPICEVSFLSVPTEFFFSLSYLLEYFYYLESVVSQMRLWTWEQELCFLFYLYLAYILIKIYWAGK